MKKLFIIASAVLALTASAAQVADSLIDKFLKFSVKDILVEHVFEGVWSSAKLYGMEPSGFRLYHTARSSTYENLGLEWTDWDSYIQGRTIIVARIKGYFFDGENLKDTYLAIQPRFKEEFSKLSYKEKDGLREVLNDTKTCFELILKPDNQAVYKSWLDQTMVGPVDCLEMSKIWLENNLSAEDIAKRIKAGELKSLPDKWDAETEAFKIYPDKDIAKFAGRRFKDGGEKLIRKYIEVIDLAIADAK